MQKTDAGPGPEDVAAEASLTPYLEAWEQLRGGRVVTALREAAEGHRRIVADVGLDGDPPAEWEARADRLLEYRRTIDAEVLAPLCATFEDRSPTATVEAALRNATEKSFERVRALPETAVAPWPADALARKPSDALGRRAGKALARVVSQARKTGEERSLPLSAVTVRHLDRVVEPEQDECGAQALFRWADWSRRLELLWSEWGRAALPALVRSELPGDEAEQAGELWSAIGEGAAKLQRGLDALLEEVPGEVSAEEARARIDIARGGLEADLAVAGSFLLRPDAAPPPSSSLVRVSRVAPALVEWDAGVAARMELHVALLSILSGSTAVQRRTIYRFRERCLGGVGDLTDIAGKLEGLAADVAGLGADASLGARFSELDAEHAAVLEPAAEALPTADVVDAAIRDISDSTIDALSSMIRQAPSALVLHSPGARPPVAGRRVETRSLALQELARQAFDALRIERIRSSTAGLLEALAGARTAIAELEGVYSFARAEADREIDSKEEGARARAVDLVEGALRSTAGALRKRVVDLEAAVVAAQSRLASEMSDGSTALLDRVGAGRMEATMFAARSRMADLRAWVADRWGPPVDRAIKYMGIRMVRLRRLGARALRRGSVMVGSAPGSTAASARTLREMADPQRATAGLPLVYQRLFAHDPVTDSALLAGRESALGEAVRRWRWWRDDKGVPIVIRGRQGSGVTSFLKVLQGQIEGDEGSVAWATVDERITSEAGLAALLAEPLGLEPTESLSDLARGIFGAERGALPDALLLDNMEHLYLRVPRGTDLIERLLTLMAETEPKIFWIGGITASAWQLVAAAEPTAIFQVDVIELAPLDAEDMRTAITLRHRRSGLAIRYEEPTTGRHLLRRRLSRMSDAERHRQLVEDDFFDRLHKAAGGHVGLALHLWLTCADFTSGDGVLMGQPSRPDFSVLDALDLTQNFTLKAFLEHRSLTLDEHDRIFRMSRQESYQVFESLRNRQLLEPLTESAGSDARSEIEDELRYRVRTLLTGTVISHLQARNIVH